MPLQSRAARASARRHLTKQQYVYSTLREAIILCELRPGERLVIDELARRLDISIIPVREALRLLESEGLVVNIAHVGSTVAPISRQSIVEVFTILEGLETVSARAAATVAGEEDLASLIEIVTAMDRALEEGLQSRWAELNTRFHLAISGLSGMPMLHEMLQRALDHWDRVRRFFFTNVFTRRAEVAQHEHHQMLQLMMSRDLVKLEEIMRAHNRSALAAYTAHLDAAGSADDARDGRPQ
jgi:DNA-binding GntR family transcriptional regulator